MNTRQKGLYIYLVVVVALCGCASFIEMAYEPTIPARPFLADRMPKIYLAGAEYKTPGVAGVNIRNPAPEVVLTRALAKEFERLHIPLVTNRRDADAVFQATWNLASVGAKPLTGTVGIALNLKTPDGRFIWSHQVVGKGSTGCDSAQDCMNEALAAAMGRLGPVFEEQAVIAKIFPAAAVLAARATDKPAIGPGVRSDVDELPQRSEWLNEKAYAVVIGIRRYLQPLPEADFADNDAKLVKTYLTRFMGYSDVNVAALINEQATKSGFEKYFESWLPNHVEDGADVFVYFSGHGAPNPKTQDAYLIPYDGDPTYLDKTGYPLKRMYAQLAKLPAGKVTVVLDSCFSGAGGRSVLAKGARPLVMVSAYEGIPDKLTVLSAAAGDQISYTYQDKGHGLFTYFFLKGIKEQSGRPVLEMKAVFDYAAPQVTGVARREYNADQIPQWYPSP
ncbi:MAG: caspase family protein [Thermodesulfobacteriota bacterium]